MHLDVNGTRLWFDVAGPALVPDGNQMRRRPTVVLVHGTVAAKDMVVGIERYYLHVKPGSLHLRERRGQPRAA